MVVATFLVVMMSGPRARSSSDQNGVFVSRHRMFHVCWHEQKTANRKGLWDGLGPNPTLNVPWATATLASELWAWRSLYPAGTKAA